MSEIILNARLFLEAIPEAVLLLKMDGFIALCNNTCTELFQQKYDNLINSRLRNFISPQHADKELKGLKGILQSGAKLDLPIHFIISAKPKLCTIRLLGIVPYQPENQRFFLLQLKEKNEQEGMVKRFIDLKNLLDLKSKQMRALGKMNNSLEQMVKERTKELLVANEQLQQEIIERKRAERATNFAYAELNQIFNTSVDGMCVINKEGKMLRMNNTFCTLFGLNEDEIIGINCYDVLHHAFCKSITCPLKRVFKGEELLEFDMPIERTDGSKIFCMVTATPFRSPDGELVGIVEDFKDITERKKLDKELQKMQKLESLGILAGGIAHDFNNLLTAIIGNLSLIELYDKSGENISGVLEQTKTASYQTKRLTQQLLIFSTGGAPIKKVASIAELLKDTVTLALSGSKAIGEFSLPDDLWLAEIDEGQIDQVVNNLIINANQAMAGGGKIRIGAENVIVAAEDDLPLQEGKYVKISIKDQGTGIKEEYLQKIFDPYFTTKQAGSGLGLAITYSIIKKHEGYITLESKIGVGTTFTIFLPALEKEIFTVEDIAEEPVYGGKGRILFMDDKESIRDVVGEMLVQLGYEVEFAKEGTEAIELYEKAKASGQKFDVVILDLTIQGGMGGVEVFRKLREIDSEVKAIVSSGYSNDPVMNKYRDYGFKGVVVKPYAIKELNEVLYKVIIGEKKVSV